MCLISYSKKQPGNRLTNYDKTIKVIFNKQRKKVINSFIGRPKNNCLITILVWGVFAFAFFYIVVGIELIGTQNPNNKLVSARSALLEKGNLRCWYVEDTHIRIVAIKQRQKLGLQVLGTCPHQKINHYGETGSCMILNH